MADAPVKVLNAFELPPAVRDRLGSISDRLVVEHRPRPDGAARDLADAKAEVLLAAQLPGRPSQMPRLSWLQVASAGVDHLEGVAGWRGLTVTNASGLYTVPVAEYVLAAMLATAQEVRARADEQRERSWRRRWELSGRLLAGTTLVLVGYGSIGREVARLASAFRMRILAVKARPDELEDRRFGERGTGDPRGSIPERVVGLDRLRDALSAADFAVVSLPLTDETRGILDADTLAALPPTACLINVGRGAVVDEGALLAMLGRGEIGDVVLDVFAEEPLPAQHPLWQAERAVLTPHVAGGRERWEVFGDLVVENLRRFLAGEALLNVVSARGY